MRESKGFALLVRSSLPADKRDMPFPALLLATVQTIAMDGAILRGGCTEDDDRLGTLSRGASVEVKYAVAGYRDGCFKVSAEVGGKKIEGFVAANALSDAAALDRERAAASDTDLPKLLQAPLAEIKESVKKAAASGALTVTGHGKAMARAVELLEANANGEALAVLQQALESGSKDPDLLALAGIAAYRADQLPVAREYLQKSLDLRPNEPIQQFADRLNKELAADKSKEKIYGGRFILRYDNAALQPAQANQLLQVIESEFSRVASELGCQTAERITTIVQSRDGYLQASGAAEWSGGLFDGTKIRVPVSADTPIGSPRMREVLAHESTHACLGAMGKYPSWLHEGLAQRMTGKQASPGEVTMVRDLLRQKELPRLSKMASGWGGMSAESAQVAYAYALVAVSTLYDHYASYGIPSLLRNPVLLQQVVQRLEADLER